MLLMPAWCCVLDDPSGINLNQAVSAVRSRIDNAETGVLQLEDGSESPSNGRQTVESS